MSLSSEPPDARIFLLLFNWHFNPRFISVFKSRALDGSEWVNISSLIEKVRIIIFCRLILMLRPGRFLTRSWTIMQNKPRTPFCLNASSYENATPHKSNICFWFTDELEVSLNTHMKICQTIPALFILINISWIRTGLQDLTGRRAFIINHNPKTITHKPWFMKTGTKQGLKLLKRVMCWNWLYLTL